jgi:hypothetical protein
MQPGPLNPACLPPGVPRLIGRGAWMSPTGQPHPWLAMEWVENIGIITPQNPDSPPRPFCSSPHPQLASCSPFCRDRSLINASSCGERSEVGRCWTSE